MKGNSGGFLSRRDTLKPLVQQQSRVRILSYRITLSDARKGNPAFVRWLGGVNAESKPFVTADRRQLAEQETGWRNSCSTKHLRQGERRIQPRNGGTNVR